VPSEVWTGSTNISDGGIHGQTNVGHWVRDAKTAGRYQAYWKLLSGDPGARDGTTAAGKKQNAAFMAEVEKITPAVLTLKAIPSGITALFSPRKGLTVLGLYVALVAEAQRSGFITLAFGINKDFKEALKGHTAKGPITFMMLEKKDAPTKKNKDTFVAINITAEALLSPQIAQLFEQRQRYDNIMLEVSEEDAQQPGVTEALSAFRAGGGRLAIDDIGAGLIGIEDLDRGSISEAVGGGEL